MSVNIQNCGNCSSHFIILPSENPTLNNSSLEGVQCPHCSSTNIGPLPSDTVIYVDEAVIVDENGDYKVINLTESPKDESPVKTQEAEENEDDIRCECCKKRFDSQRMLYKHYSYMQKQKSNTCFLCHKVFKYPSALKMHYENHLQYKPFSCEYCEKTFSIKPALEKHLKMHYNQRIYRCEICDSRFYSLNILEGHYRFHTGEKPFACPVCDLRFHKRKLCSIHQKKVNHSPEVQVTNPLIQIPYADREFFCEICNQRFAMECMLLSHYRKHPSAKRFACDHNSCKIFYLSELRLVKHAADHKNGTFMTYRADLMSESYIRKDTFMEGVDPNDISEIDILNMEIKGEVMDSIEEPVDDDDYDVKLLSMKDALENSQSSSTKQIDASSKFTCEICDDKTFKFSYTLTEHYMICHTGEKLWECAVCKKRFPTKKYFDLHRKLFNHKGLNKLKLHKKNFFCEICETEFILMGILLTHYSKHPEAVRYVCEVCKLFFLGKEQLEEHYEQHSADEISAHIASMAALPAGDILADDDHVNDVTEPMDTSESFFKLENINDSSSNLFVEHSTENLCPTVLNTPTAVNDSVSEIVKPTNSRKNSNQLQTSNKLGKVSLKNKNKTLKKQTVVPDPSLPVPIAEKPQISHLKKDTSNPDRGSFTVNANANLPLHTYFFNYGNNNYVWAFTVGENMQDDDSPDEMDKESNKNSLDSPGDLDKNPVKRPNQNLIPTNIQDASESPVVIEFLKKFAAENDSESNSLSCSICKEQFEMRVGLERHICPELKKLYQSHTVTTSEILSKTMKVKEKTKNISKAPPPIDLNKKKTIPKRNPNSKPGFYFCDSCNLAFTYTEDLNDHKAVHSRVAAIQIDSRGNKIIEYAPKDESLKDFYSSSPGSIPRNRINESHMMVQSTLKSRYGLTLRGVVTVSVETGLTDKQCISMKRGTKYIVYSDQLHKCLLCGREFIQRHDLKRHYERNNCAD